MKVDRWDNHSGEPQVSLLDFLYKLGKRNLAPGGQWGRQAVLKMLAPEQKLLVFAPETSSFEYLSKKRIDVIQVQTLRDFSEGIMTQDFDSILIENAFVTLEQEAQVEIFKLMARNLRPGARCIVHEVCWRQEVNSKCFQQIESAWGGQVSIHGLWWWWNFLRSQGFERIESQVGTLSWLQKKQMLQAEEPIDIVEFFFRGISDHKCSERFFQAFNHFRSYGRFYGSLVLKAEKPH